MLSNTALTWILVTLITMFFFSTFFVIVLAWFVNKERELLKKLREEADAEAELYHNRNEATRLYKYPRFTVNDYRRMGGLKPLTEEEEKSWADLTEEDWMSIKNTIDKTIQRIEGMPGMAPHGPGWDFPYGGRGSDEVFDQEQQGPTLFDDYDVESVKNRSYMAVRVPEGSDARRALDQWTDEVAERHANVHQLDDYRNRTDDPSA